MIEDYLPRTNNNKCEFIVECDFNIFAINIFLKANIIKIETINTDSNKKYVNELTLKDWINLNKFLSSFQNIKEIYKKIKEMNNDDFSIVKNDNIIINLKIKFIDRFQSYPTLIPLKEDGKKEEEFNISNKLEENKPLKIDREDLEKRVEELEDFINKFKFSLPFMDFDISLYELEKVYNNLDSLEIISNRRHLGFINSGIKSIFKKNIKDFTLRYKFIVGQNSELWILNQYLNLSNILNFPNLI